MPSPFGSSDTCRRPSVPSRASKGRAKAAPAVAANPNDTAPLVSRPSVVAAVGNAESGRRRRPRRDSGVALFESPSRDQHSSPSKSPTSQTKSRTKSAAPRHGGKNPSTAWSVAATGSTQPSSARTSSDRVRGRSLRETMSASTETDSLDVSLQGIGIWCPEAPRRVASPLPEAPLPPAWLAEPGLSFDPPSAPLIPRLRTPDLVPMSMDAQFCPCCDEPNQDRINEIWYLTGRTKMDSQREWPSISCRP
jgi:hypothetical protein